MYEHLPKDCSIMKIWVEKDGKRIHEQTLLPHQLYLEKLLKITENMRYPLYYEPVYPEYPKCVYVEENR